MEQAGEGVEADLALADMRVAVAAGGEGADGVVEVQGADGGEADALFDLGKEIFVAAAVVDRIAGGEGVAGVEADADAARRGEPATDARQMLEPMAEAGALAGGVLEQHTDADPRQRGEDGRERGGRAIHAGLLAGSQVGAGMDDEGADAQPGAAGELVSERQPRAREQLRIGGAEVDQVAGVGDQRPDAARGVRGAEGGDLAPGELPALPLVGVLDEDLDRRAAEGGGPFDRGGHAARHGDVGTEGRQGRHCAGLWRTGNGKRLDPSGRFGMLRPMLARLLRGLGLVVYALLILLVFGLAAYTSFSLFVRSGVTTVPSVIGLTRTEAANVLADQGLRLRIAEGAGRYDDKVPAGRVARQNRDPRTLVKRGSSVNVVLSLGPRRVVVPDLAGKPLPAAQAAISGSGLALGRILGAYASRREAGGSVLEQDPDPGASVAPGSAVDLLLAMSVPGERYVMPDLVYRSYERVRPAFERSRFKFGNVKFERYEGVAEGVILRQFPLPGHPLTREDAISLVVATADLPEAPAPAEGVP